MADSRAVRRGLYFVKTPFWMRWLYPQALWKGPPAGEKCLYLTFDDGPIPEMTPFILNILGAYGSKATFFCVGDNVRKYPELYARILAEGHTTGNHTFNHLNGWKTPLAQYVENVEMCSRYVSSRLFRPPYGSLTPAQYGALKKTCQVVFWDVLSGDFDPAVSPERCLRHVTDHAVHRSVIVLHDNIKSKKNVEYALPRLLEHFLEQGYAFCPLPSS